MPEPDAGPETLASLLPEPPGDWPPRRSRSKRRDKSARAPIAPRDDAGTLPAAAAPDAAPAETEAAASAEPARDPRFLREARRSAFWNRPAMRATLSVLLLGLAVGAAGQAAYPFRDLIAARWPVTAPGWHWFCAQAGCEVQAPRSLASLGLDGTTLTQTETDHVLLFSADLHNRAAWPVRAPAFDLKFTDLGGQVVARRIFRPAALGLAVRSLPPDGELHVRARLKLDGVDVAGFQAEVFYP